MTLSIETAVTGVADVLRDKVTPALSDGFAIEATRLSTMMLTIMANAADDAVALRVAENARLRIVLGEAAGTVDQPALAEQLRAAAASGDPGLRISELDAETDRLRRLLVRLQEHIEDQGGDGAAGLSQRIWRMLRDFEAARAPRLQAPAAAPGQAA